MSFSPGEGWIFIGIDDNNTQFFIDPATMERDHDEIKVTVISVPDNEGETYLEIQEVLRQENIDPAGLRCIEQSWRLNLSQGTYAICDRAFKSGDGRTIHSIAFSPITRELNMADKIAEKIVLRLTSELECPAGGKK